MIYIDLGGLLMRIFGIKFEHKYHKLSRVLDLLSKWEVPIYLADIFVSYARGPRPGWWPRT